MSFSQIVRPVFAIGILGGLLILSTLPTLPAADSPKKPRVEEEETPAPKTPPPEKKRAEEEEPPPKPPAKRTPAAVDLVKEAREATRPAVRNLYTRLARPYDIVVPRVGPSIPVAHLASTSLPPEGDFEFFALEKDRLTGHKVAVPVNRISAITPYETWALEAIDGLPKAEAELPRLERLEAVVKGMRAVLFTHLGLRERGLRPVAAWEAVTTKLRDKLAVAEGDLLTAYREAKLWEKGAALAATLADEYGEAIPKPMVREAARLELAQVDARTHPGNDKDFLKLREALTAFERRAPGDDFAEPIRRKLRLKAEELIGQARSDSRDKKTAEALVKIRLAEELEPGLEAVGKMRNDLRLRDPILYVGVPRLPTSMSPLTAREPADRWAVELLFESLVEALPDPAGGTVWVPRLAEQLPRVAAQARDFLLRDDLRWDAAADPELDVRDIPATLDLYRRRPELLGSAGTDRVAGFERLEGPRQFRLKLRQPGPDPLSALAFKILPARQLAAGKLDPAGGVFGAKPFGSGPYRYAGEESESMGRRVAVFRANPAFAQRAGQTGLPTLREVRMVVPNADTVVEDFQAGQFHLWPDLPPTLVPRLKTDPSYRLVRHRDDRRVWALAVNHRRTALQSPELRRGLLQAIDRERILKEVYPIADGTRPVAGPFPPKSWPTPDKAADLYRFDLAGSKLASALEGRTLELKVAYPKDDPDAAEVCKRIRDQTVLAATTGDKTPLTVTLLPLDAEAFARRVYTTFDYDLAYVPIDYPDDRFDLSPLLDPTACTLGGRNFLGYLAGDASTEDDRRLRQTVLELRACRDFTGRARELARQVHQQVNQQVPFVPLWQLERVSAVSTSLELRFDESGQVVKFELLDPATLFARAERWRLK